MIAGRRAGAALVAIAAVLVSLAGCGGGTVDVTATFDDVGDLQSRHSVQVADVRVGSIGSITLTDDFKARVTLRLDGDARIPRSSTAVLRTTSLLGEKFIELRPQGDPGVGPYLRDGDHINDTEEAPELEFLAEQATAVLGAVAGSDVAAIIETGASAFGGRRTELASLIEDLATISATLAERSGAMTRIIDGLDEATATLAAGDSEVSALLSNLATTTKVLADNRQRAVTALAELSRLADSQNVILDRYRTDVDRQIKQLDAIAATAVQHTGEVANLIDWLDRFVVGLPKAIPGEFTQIFIWFIPADEDPRVGT